MDKWEPYPLTEEQKALKGLKLHLGPNLTGIHTNNFINIDIDPRNRVADTIGNALDLSMFGSNTIDLILSSHIIEHFNSTDAVKALKEWHRVLKPGGWLVMELPDLDKCMLMFLNATNNEQRKDALIGIYGRFDWVIYQGHQYGYNHPTLREILLSVGFKSTEKKHPLRNHAFDRSMRIDAQK